MLEFTAHEEFSRALIEVDALIEMAANHQNDGKYSLFNKSAILLLSAKLENFYEQSLTEFVNEINKLDLQVKDLPRNIVESYIESLTKGNFLAEVQKYKPQVKDGLLKLANLWDPQARIYKLQIENKFNYGKHGSNELKNLYKRVGIINIFDLVEITDVIESLIEPQTIVIDMKAIVDTLTEYRNKIIHEDHTPTLSHNDIMKYRNHSLDFTNQIVEQLKKKINSIKPHPVDLIS